MYEDTDFKKLTIFRADGKDPSYSVRGCGTSFITIEFERQTQILRIDEIFTILGSGKSTIIETNADRFSYPVDMTAYLQAAINTVEIRNSPMNRKRES